MSGYCIATPHNGKPCLLYYNLSNAMFCVKINTVAKSIKRLTCLLDNLSRPKTTTQSISTNCSTSAPPLVCLRMCCAFALPPSCACLFS